MIISWKQNQNPINTKKSYGFPVEHEGHIRVMWIPQSQVEKFDKENRTAKIPDELYNKEFNELFFERKVYK